jgi:TPR repeat protein
MRWYRRAAEHGDVAAEYGIGLLYANGWGVPSDIGEAAQWMQKSASAGNPDARDWLKTHAGRD